MPNPNANPSSNANSEQRGFSLVELLVALLFTSILMAGMAKVFQSSLGVFVASSETISSGRRNRMAMDLLYDDLNKAGMVPSTLFWYPAVNITLNPPFQVTPNVSYDPTSKTDVAAALAKADMLDFFYDEILPYDATLSTELLNTSQQVALGGATTAGQLGGNASFNITFRDKAQATDAAAQFTQSGMSILFRSSGYTYKLAGLSASSATASATLSSDSTYTGTGAATGATFLAAAPSGTGVTLMQPGRYARYSIQPRALDPANATVFTPCLIRDEVSYATVSASATPFAAPEQTTLVAENVIGFKVLLSGDGGKTWAGGNTTDTTWANITGPSTGAASPTLNWQLASGSAPARAGMNSTASSPFWFREIPVLVRLDVTTRTINKRTEYSATTTTAAYRTQTQSLILAPRHSGLAYQPIGF